MFVYVRRRVIDTETASRVELRLLEGHPELGYHWVDVPSRGLVAACGLHVDSYIQWRRHHGTSALTVCRGCDHAMPSPQDQPLDA